MMKGGPIDHVVDGVGDEHGSEAKTKDADGGGQVAL